MKLRILLAGMNYAPNQFTRNIEKLGCEVVSTSGDPGSFPKWCDAAIIAKCQCSHQKYWDVKNAYLQAKKPVFTAENFSSIGESVTEFVRKKKEEMAGRTVLGRAFTAAAKDIKPVLDRVISDPPKPLILPEPKEEIVMAKKTISEFRELRYDPAVKAKILKEIDEAHAAGFSARETAELLKQHGFKQADGIKDINDILVANFRAVIKKKKEREGQTPPAKAIHQTTNGKAAPAPVKAAPKKTNEFQILSRILDLDLSDDKTVQFQRWLKDGKINLEQAMWFLDVIEDKLK